MDLFLKTFLNARSLKSVTKELSIEQLEDTLVKLQKIVDDRKARLIKEEAAQKVMLEKMYKYKEMFEADGIDPNDFAKLVGAAGSLEKVKRSPLSAKYRYKENGAEKTWTGQGRMPAVIKKAVESGKRKEDFLI